MSIANAAHCSMIGGGKAVIRALSGSGNIGSNFTYIDASITTFPDITVDMWFKPNNYPSHGCLFNYTANENLASGGNGLGFGFGAQNSMMSNGTYLNILFNAQAWKHAVTLDYNGWHHIAVSVKYYSGSSSPKYTAVAYFDGSQIYTVTNSLIARVDRIQLLGYSAQGGWERYFGGLATEVCLHNEILTPAQVAARYAEGMTAPSSFAGISHYWNGEMIGDKVMDKIGNWNLTINGDASIVTL